MCPFRDDGDHLYYKFDDDGSLVIRRLCHKNWIGSGCRSIMPHMTPIRRQPKSPDADGWYPSEVRPERECAVEIEVARGEVYFARWDGAIFRGGWWSLERLRENWDYTGDTGPFKRWRYTDTAERPSCAGQASEERAPERLRPASGPLPAPAHPQHTPADIAGLAREPAPLPVAIATPREPAHHHPLLVVWNPDDRAGLRSLGAV